MNKSIEERVRNVMSSVFDVSTDKIKNDTSPDTIDSWDSLKHMNLIIGLEEEFGIEFDDDDIGNLLNFDLIKIYIEEILSIS
jgi:acyl carrier protein